MNQPIWLTRTTEIHVDSPEVGDRVTLHFDQTHRYMVTVDVTGVNSGGFSGTVIAVFDRDSRAQILVADILSLVGATVSFGQPDVIATISRPAP